MRPTPVNDAPLEDPAPPPTNRDAGVGEQEYTIDELAARTGMTVRTVRFYAAEGLLPVIHFWLSVLSLLALIPALTLFLLGHTAMAAPLGAASIALWLSMLLFAVIVFKATWRAA